MFRSKTKKEFDKMIKAAAAMDDPTDALMDGLGIYGANVYVLAKLVDSLRQRISPALSVLHDDLRLLDDNIVQVDLTGDEPVDLVGLGSSFENDISFHRLMLSGELEDFVVTIASLEYKVRAIPAEDDREIDSFAQVCNMLSMATTFEGLLTESRSLMLKTLSGVWLFEPVSVKEFSLEKTDEIKPPLRNL